MTTITKTANNLNILHNNLSGHYIRLEIGHLCTNRIKCPGQITLFIVK